jgi:predicted CXXCH cytochrome family protein
MGIVATIIIVLSMPLYWVRSAYFQTNNTIETGEPQFVGAHTCIECHKIEYDLWVGSDHDLAMDVANDSTVKGDFNDAVYSDERGEHRFYKKENKYFVYTTGPNGQMDEFEMSHVFGHFPLQQYLVPFEGGKLQTLSLTWNSEKGEWYDMAKAVYPNEKIEHTNWLHWTKLGQNWNGMCADCHSTNLQKGYDYKTGEFHTTWSEIDVSCEACHGPSSEHLKWANLPEMARPANTNTGLVVQTSNIDNKRYVDLCARCHTRRSALKDYDYKWHDLLDQMVADLPTKPNYFVDGQILEEDYVFGSFTQSRMYLEDVKCNDCHNVHSGKLVLDGNQLCLQCHRSDVYDTYSHHFHKYEGKGTLKVVDEFGVEQAVGSGAQCINCHMPGRYYMGVDYRRDHSFRIPRPDLSDKLGTPNACTQCHADKNNNWASNYIKEWYGKRTRPHYGEIFAEAYDSQPEAFAKLVKLANDDLYPAIVRASALSLMGDYFPDSSIQVMHTYFTSDESLLRYTAIRHYPMTSLEGAKTLLPLLNDPVKAVRIEAAVSLMVVPQEQLPKNKIALLNTVLSEYREAMEYSADFAASRHNLGNFYNNQSKFREAIIHYKEAIHIDDEFYPAKVNLAMIYNRQGENEKAALLLKNVVQNHPEIDDVYYSLGLLLAEMKMYEESVNYLKQASEKMQYNARVFYNLGQVQQVLGENKEAENSFKKALDIDPENFDFLWVLADFYLKNERYSDSKTMAEKMELLYPANGTSQQILERIVILTGNDGN